MRLFNRLKSQASTIVLVALLAAVGAYEWKQWRGSDGIPSARATVAAPASSSVLAEGRVVVPPGSEITVGAELSGKLHRLSVKEKAQVKAGDVLAEIDVAEQQAALQEAWARVKEAGTDLDYALQERQRSQQLWNSNVVAASALDRSVYDAKAAERRRGSLLAGAARISANLAKAKVLAPLGGTITERFVDAGEMLEAGTPIVTITDLTQLRVEAEVGEFDAARVQVGAAVKIRAEGHETTWQGRVEEVPDRVVPRALKPLDPSRPVDTRVLIVKVSLSEPVPLKLGQRVEVEVQR